MFWNVTSACTGCQDVYIEMSWKTDMKLYCSISFLHCNVLVFFFILILVLYFMIGLCNVCFFSFPFAGNWPQSRAFGKWWWNVSHSGLLKLRANWPECCCDNIQLWLYVKGSLLGSLLAHRQLSWAIVKCVVSILCSSFDLTEIFWPYFKREMSDDRSSHLAPKIRNWWQAH